MTLRIVAVSHSSERNGAELSLQQVCAELVQRGHRLVVTVPDIPAENGCLSGEWRLETIRTRKWMGRRYNLFVGMVRLAQSICDTIPHIVFLRRERPDVVVVNTCVIPAPLLACQVLRIPVVLFVRESFRTNPSLRCALPRSTVGFLIRRLPSLVVANSEYVKSQIGDDFVASVIYPPVAGSNESKIVEDGSSATYIDRASPSALRVVHVGSIGGDKGQQDLLDAIEILHERGVAVSTRFYGGGAPHLVSSFIIRVRALYAQGIDVQYCGVVVDVSAVYLSSDVTVVTSRNEAFGRVTLESISVGTPVIGYDAGGTAEILGRGGGLAVSANPEALAVALATVSSNRRILEDLRESCRGHPLLHTESVVDACDLIESVQSLV
ncbi:glycosyltransferase family 4 protein [Gordonia sputi]